MPFSLKASFLLWKGFSRHLFAYFFFLALQSGGLPWLAKHTPFGLQQCGTFCVLQQDCTEKENL